MAARPDPGLFAGEMEVDLLGLLESRGYVPVARTRVYVMVRAEIRR